MNAELMKELAHYLQNSADGQKIAEHSNLSQEELVKIAEVMLPKMTSQVQNSSQSLSDLVALIAQNKDNPKSLLNATTGFDTSKAHEEGNEILQTLFGHDVQKDEMADEISQKTGVNSEQITNILPMVAAMATKILGGKTETTANGEQGDFKNSFLEQVAGLLGSEQGSSLLNELGRLGKEWISGFLNKK